MSRQGTAASANAAAAGIQCVRRTYGTRYIVVQMTRFMNLFLLSLQPSSRLILSEIDIACQQQVKDMLNGQVRAPGSVAAQGLKLNLRSVRRCSSSRVAHELSVLEDDLHQLVGILHRGVVASEPLVRRLRVHLEDPSPHILR